MPESQRAWWREVLLLVPPGLAAVNYSVEPALLIAGAVVALMALGDNLAVRVASIALAVGALSGPGLELPVAWIALGLAGALAEGPRRLAVLPALLGLLWSLCWGIDSAAWPVAGALAALSVGVGGISSVGTVLPVLLLLAGIGGIRAQRLNQKWMEVRPDEMPLLAEQFGAAWMASRAEEALIRSGALSPDATAPDRARMLAELGSARLGFRALGTSSLPTWERAALLNQAGRTVPARLLGWAAEAAEGWVQGPGVVFERPDWAEAGRVVAPVRLGQRTTELVVRSAGEGRLLVQVAGVRMGPIEVEEQGGEWTIQVALGAGVHRLTVDGSGALRDVVVELR